jgi:peptidoglycan-N-acetylglucosamine deacetylase
VRATEVVLVQARRLAIAGGAAAAIAALALFPTVEANATSRLSEPAEKEIAKLLRLGLPIRCGGLHSRYVALTFDDGPGPYSELALEILARVHARATFFLVGKELRYWPRVARRELRLAALGDHTWTHRDLLALPDSAVREELASTRTAIQQETGLRVQLFRPPYGATSTRVGDDATRLGMLQVLWSIDSRDSEGASWSAIGAQVARQIRGGSIVLMHENRGQTIRALKYLVLPLLRARHLVTGPCRNCWRSILHPGRRCWTASPAAFRGRLRRRRERARHHRAADEDDDEQQRDRDKRVDADEQTFRRRGARPQNVPERGRLGLRARSTDGDTDREG